MKSSAKAASRSKISPTARGSKAALQLGAKAKAVASGSDTTLPSVPASLHATGESVQDAPILFKSDGLVVAALKIDSAAWFGNQLIISGWRMGPISLQILADGEFAALTLAQSKRPDVAAVLRIPEPNDGLGVTLTAEIAGDASKISLEGIVEFAGRKYSYEYDLRIEDRQQPVNGSAARSLGVGFLEALATSEATNEAILVGWMLPSADATVWIETESGLRYEMGSAYRFPRQDVFDVHPFEALNSPSTESGFILRINGVVPDERVRLVFSRQGQVKIIGEIQATRLSLNPVAAAKWLFGLVTPDSTRSERYSAIDIPVISKLIELQQSGWQKSPPTVRQLGCAVQKPIVSIIIPLYGRYDFVEQQVLQFCKDEWIREKAEIIYVVDDPNIVEQFAKQAEFIYRLYKLPFKWVWGHMNRGFAAANNLGAMLATANYFLFLNSDVFPQQKGWAEALINVLEKNPQIGAVGPRLVFADGSIQHAGMEFRRHEAFQVWVNHHPNMGLDPAMDPTTQLTKVPAITGACMAVRENDFSRIGGWDSQYLVGDFEDSDLCLALRRDGLACAYLPTEQLTHLERQSFKLLGDDLFRQRVVIYNAIRHQNKWRVWLEGSGKEND